MEWYDNSLQSDGGEIYIRFRVGLGLSNSGLDVGFFSKLGLDQI
jgi:hypothetical protein